MRYVREAQIVKGALSKYEAKTKPTQRPVEDFIAEVDDPVRRADAIWVDAMMRRISGEEPRMWGPSIIGYGQYHYRYESGHEGDAPRLGFSPRKAELVLYVLEYGEGDRTEEDALLKQLGKYRRGKSCLYVRRLDGVDKDALERLAERSWKQMAERYPR